METEQNTPILQESEKSTPSVQEAKQDTPIQQEAVRAKSHETIKAIFCNWAFLFFYAFILGTVLTNVEHPEMLMDHPPFFLTSSLGKAIGALIVPLIIAGVHRLSVRKKSTDGMFLAYYIIATVTFLMVLMRTIELRSA